MKIDYSKPLTPEQARMVEENHNLIYSFLYRSKLAIDDYYALAAEGLIRGAQAYDQDERLQQYSFSTIAYWKMNGEIYRHKRKTSQYPQMLSLDYMPEDFSLPIASAIASQKADTAMKQVLDKIELEKIFSRLTPEQHYIIAATLNGVHQVTIAQKIGVSQVEISRRLKKIRKIIKQQYAQEVCV